MSISRDANLDKQTPIIEADFTHVPLSSESVSVVWSQEALLHALEVAEHRSLGANHLAEVDDLLLGVREVADHVFGAALEDLVLQRVELGGGRQVGAQQQGDDAALGVRKRHPGHQPDQGRPGEKEILPGGQLELIEKLENMKAFWVTPLKNFYGTVAGACDGDDSAVGEVEAGVVFAGIAGDHVEVGGSSGVVAVAGVEIDAADRARTLALETARIVQVEPSQSRSATSNY